MSCAHGELVQDVMVAGGVCCERCPGATAANTSRIARRRLLKAAVVATRTGAIGADQALAAIAGPPYLYRAVTGRIVDVSPHFIAIGDSRGEQRFTLTADARAWRGTPLEPSALTPGDQAVIRLRPSGQGVADRIWADIGRVTGTIVQRDSDSLLVEESATRQKQVVVISRQASGRIQVRFPNLRPGYLIDLIGIRRRGVLEGLVPAAYQPTYPVSQLTVPAMFGGRPPDIISGSATWHDAVDEPYGVLGVCYPAVDPATGCAEDAAAGLAPGQAPAYRSLPYLAVGSALIVRNEYTGLSRALPVTGCAPVARMFNDRCVACDTSQRGLSPRGRVADLTLASFVALGGELELGCFNAAITLGG